MKPDFVERLNSEVANAMNAPDVRGKLSQVELDVATSTPAEAGKFVRARWSAERA